MVHKNLVPTSADHNDIFTLGGGGRMKISNHVSINAEYHHIFKGQVASSKVYDSFSTGVDIETGGHVFQIFLTNSEGKTKKASSQIRPGVGAKAISSSDLISPGSSPSFEPKSFLENN